eukprot:m.133175 g.133175  ORF g.133175 m.133175 type:complete len:270 (+) comp14666_c0_seq3:530-1339(+)
MINKALDQCFVGERFTVGIPQRYPSKDAIDSYLTNLSNISSCSNKGVIYATDLFSCNPAFQPLLMVLMSMRQREGLSGSSFLDFGNDSMLDNSALSEGRSFASPFAKSFLNAFSGSTVFTEGTPFPSNTNASSSEFIHTKFKTGETVHQSKLHSSIHSSNQEEHFSMDLDTSSYVWKQSDEQRMSLGSTKATQIPATPNLFSPPINIQSHPSPISPDLFSPPVYNKPHLQFCRTPDLFSPYVPPSRSYGQYDTSPPHSTLGLHTLLKTN